MHEWWTDWGWDVIPKVFLPKENVCVEYNGVPVAAAFIYHTQTPICWIENYISDKNFKDDRKLVVDSLIKECLRQAKEQGFHVAMSAITHKNLAKALVENNFFQGGVGLTNYIRGL